MEGCHPQLLLLSLDNYMTSLTFKATKGVADNEYVEKFTPCVMPRMRRSSLFSLHCSAPHDFAQLKILFVLCLVRPTMIEQGKKTVWIHNSEAGVDIALVLNFGIYSDQTK